MKKMIVFLLIFSLISSIFILSISAEEDNQASETDEVTNLSLEDLPYNTLELLGVTDEEKSILNPKNEDKLIKYYSCIATGAFYKGMTVEEAISSSEFVREASYLYQTRGGVSDAGIRDGKLLFYSFQDVFIIQWSINFLNDWINVLYNSELTKDLYNSLEVERLYFLSEGHNYGGLYLYIVTNNGDYIYFQRTHIDDKYLVTLDVFYDICKNMYPNNAEQDGSSLIGSMDISDYKVEVKSVADKAPGEKNDIAPKEEDSTIVDEQTTENITTQTEEVQNGCSSSLTSMAIIIPAITAAYVIKKKKED